MHVQKFIHLQSQTIIGKQAAVMHSNSIKNKFNEVNPKE